jgi:hypothetical protein
MIGTIYAIRSPYTTKIYIGSTIYKLEKRFSNHIYDYTRYKNGKHYSYCASYKIIELGDAYIDKLVDIEYDSIDELHEKEHEIILMFSKWAVNIETMSGHINNELSVESIRAYDYHWNYLKQFITDINNVSQTISQLNSITTTSKGNQVNIYTKRNYMSAVLHQIRNNPDLKNQYLPYNRELIDEISTISKKQECSNAMKLKLKDLTWTDIIQYKNEIIKSKAVTDENKLLIRLYTELPYPVRNDFANITVFIDKPRPATFNGNCIMLTRKPIIVKPRKSKPRIIKPTVVVSDDECDDIEFYPVRNIIWLTDFKTSKTYSDIIQPIPDQLANDLIDYCTKNINTGKLFRVSTKAISTRIIAMFYQVSKRNIGINVLRHLKIMDEYKDTPMLHARKQTANMMGHSVDMQERYRLILD